MIKQVIAIIALSFAIILSMAYVQQGVQLLLSAHEWISNILTDVFSGGQTGSLLKGLIALLTVPVIAALVPALIYWMTRRSWFPYFMEIVWVVWLVQAGALVALYKVAGV
jgi:hypothetical protein